MTKISEVTANQIKYMVDRFLSWRLPEDFNPDGGISFKRMRNEHTSFPAKNEPVGTNLFDATQAEVMVRYLIDGMPGLYVAGKGETMSERVARYVVGWLLLPVFVAVGTWNHLREWSEEIWGILCEIAKGRF